MSGSRYLLNPYANSFMPSKKSEAIKNMAAKSLVELYEKKKANGETTVTNQEILRLVERFISIGYKELTDSDKVKIQDYLNKKLLSSKVPAVRPVADLEKIRSKISMKHTKLETFDASKFPTPQVTFLLAAFWGLYRHEQAQRPLLSLTYRPNRVKDETWSVDASDMKLWNQSCVSEVCECPPVFGYSVPSNFFGGLSHVFYKCPIQKIHLNHYSESKEGNEFILTDNWHHSLVDEQPFEDLELNINIRVDAAALKDQFEVMISGICNLLTKFTDDTGNTTEDIEADDEIDYYTSLWDDIHSNVSHVPFFQQNRDGLVDDNDHPLLEVSDVCTADYNFDAVEVPLEVKEMIRRSLSHKKDKFTIRNVDLDEENSVACDPPCSIWCNSVGKDFEDPEILKDVPMVDLVSLEQLDSKEKLEPVNINLKPVLNLCGNKLKLGHRSFSVGDCDPCYRETNFDFGCVTAHTSNLMTPNDMFVFLKKDPVNFLKSFNRIDSWEDTDSGFVSRSSSQDDLFAEVLEHQERDSTWKSVSGEDSLWKPLPECVDTNDTKMFYPHKRIRDFRHQRSVS